MQYIINNNYGGFTVPHPFREKYCNSLKYGFCFDADREQAFRTDPEAIDWVLNSNDSDLAVVEIPDKATDWMLQEYDGLESVLAVIDGLICYCKEVAR